VARPFKKGTSTVRQSLRDENVAAGLNIPALQQIDFNLAYAERRAIAG
jgi:hypothetical protein